LEIALKAIYLLKMYTEQTTKILISVLIVVFVVSGIFIPTKKAEALWGVGDLSITVGDIPRLLKDYVVDPLVNALVQRLIDEITNDIVSWIQTGFDGNPAFVDDLGGFLGDTADIAVGDFIEESSQLSFLCSPFQLEIKLALLQRNRFDRQITCTLTEVTDNIDNFLGGDFSDGGWAAWFELTQKPQNNPYGAYLLASSELDRLIASKVKEENTKLEFGRGFLTKEACYAYEICVDYGGAEALPGENLPCLEYKTVISTGTPLKDLPDGAQCLEKQTLTPGSVIEGQLQQVLPKSLERITVADEIDEVISTLINYMVNAAFGALSGGGNDPSSGLRNVNTRSLSSQELPGANISPPTQSDYDREFDRFCLNNPNFDPCNQDTGDGGGSGPGDRNDGDGRLEGLCKDPETRKRIEEESPGECDDYPLDDGNGSGGGNNGGNGGGGGGGGGGTTESISSQDQSSIVKLSNWASPGKGSQIAMLSNGRFRADKRVNNTPVLGNTYKSITAAVNEFCASNSPCAGGSLNSSDQSAVLKLINWTAAYTNRNIGLRFESGGNVFVDWRAGAASGKYGPTKSISNTAGLFCGGIGDC